VRITLQRAGLYSLTITNVLGADVRALSRGHHNAGVSEFVLDASALPTGVYFCVLTGEGIRLVDRLLLVR
jgi:hypothetical protein